MSEPSPTLLAQLLRNKEYRRKIIESGGLTPVQLNLRQWQSQRLAKTYQDFAKSKRYRAATRFFQQQLYGPDDFSQRDADIERIYPMMTKVLSNQALKSISLAMELNILTQELDAQLETQVLKRIEDESASITADLYAESYRACDNKDKRLQQIEYLVRIGEVLDEVVTNPVLYATIKIARFPAKLAGFGRLQDFVESGFSAFRKMKGAEDFLQAIHDRETEIMTALFAGKTIPDWATP